MIWSYMLASSMVSERLTTEAQTCGDYIAIIDAWKNVVKQADLPLDHPARCLCNVWDNVSLIGGCLLVVDNRRIIVPQYVRKEILNLLHEGHAGMTKTYATAHYGITSGLACETTLPTLWHCQPSQQPIGRCGYNNDGFDTDGKGCLGHFSSEKQKIFNYGRLFLRISMDCRAGVFG